MRAVSVLSVAPSISAALGNGSDAATTLGTESDDGEWFAPCCWAILGKDAGVHLHHLTGYPESSCYAYAARNPAKRRKPPEHFLRKLFRSDQGGPFMAAFMAGCTARWWLDLERSRQLAAVAERFKREIDALT